MQGWTDTPLNARGVEQANRIAGRMQEEMGISAIYASPLQRAWQTAETIGKAIGVAPVIEPRLKERGLGIIEGLTFAQVKERYPELFEQWHSERMAFPEEEPRTVFHERVRDLIHDIQQRHAEGRIGLVTHGGALGMFMAIVLQLDLERNFPFRFDNACLNVVEFGGRAPRVVALNDTCHLRHAEQHSSAEQEFVLDARVAAGGQRLHSVDSTPREAG